MAASEFNQRLDYLISYSSQLVFVCSDKITSPSQVIEDFLSNQQEQADLALLTANELTPLVIYREKLFRQLINQDQSADFNRPLNQLLAGLNQQNGSIVISIFQADKLPNKLVKELWDLVLQSRFAKNNLQLNILLVGSSTWAEQIKPRLASKTKEQPIILTSDTIERHVEKQELSELETLIQDNRKKFAQRIQARSQTTYLPQPVFKKWWVVAIFFIIFLTIFSGLLSWQYPEKRDAALSFLLGTIQSPKSQQSESSVTNTTSSPDKITTPIGVLEAENPMPNFEMDNTSESQALATKALPVEPKVIKDELITNWAAASAKLEQRTNKILANNSQPAPSTVDLEPAETAKPAELKSTISEPIDNAKDSETVQVGRILKPNLNDYAVEDIYQPEQAVFTAPAPITKAVSVNQELRPTHEAIAGLADSEFVIQIAAMANKSILQEYINDTQLADQLWLYKTQRYGADWYVLLKNQAFISIQDARAQIANLPIDMVRNTPFVKSVSQVKQEITQSNPQS